MGAHAPSTWHQCLAVWILMVDKLQISHSPQDVSVPFSSFWQMCGRHCANICMPSTSGRKDHKDYDGFCTRLCLFFGFFFPSACLRGNRHDFGSPKVCWDIGWPRYHRPGLTQAFEMTLKSKRSGSECRFFCCCFFCTNTDSNKQTNLPFCFASFLRLMFDTTKAPANSEQ